MLALALALVLQVPPFTVASSAAQTRKPTMVLLFRRWDAFFPLACVQKGAVRVGVACLTMMPRAPVVRLMDGKTVTLSPLASHQVSAWDGAPERGWELKTTEPRAAETETELAVWPADANPGLEPPPPSVATNLAGLEALPMKESALPKKRSASSPEPSSQVEQAFEFEGHGTIVSVSGDRAGLYLKSAKGWRPVRVAEPTEVEVSVLGRVDLDGDQRAEWLVFVKGWNEFGLELRSADLKKVLFSFNDCGV